MGITMFNINSPYNITEDTLELVFDNSGFLSYLACTIPVFLVDRDLMDVVCPPQIQPQLTAECVQEIIRSFNEEYGDQLGPASTESRSHWERMKKPESIAADPERLGHIVGQNAQGSNGVSFKAVYCQSLSPVALEEIERRIKIRIPFSRHLGENRQSQWGSLSDVPTLGDLANYQKVFGRLGKITSDPAIAGFQSIIEEHRRTIPKDEAILICMERVVRAAGRIKENREFRSLHIDTLVEIVFSATVLHQLAHAYIKTAPDSYYTPSGRILVEGLVTAYTLSCFKDEQSKAVVRTYFSRQPLECPGLTRFEHLSQSELQDLLRIWSRNNMRNGSVIRQFRKSAFRYPHLREQSIPEPQVFSNQPEEF